MPERKNAFIELKRRMDPDGERAELEFVTTEGRAKFDVFVDDLSALIQRLQDLAFAMEQKQLELQGGSRPEGSVQSIIASHPHSFSTGLMDGNVIVGFQLLNAAPAYYALDPEAARVLQQRLGDALK